MKSQKKGSSLQKVLNCRVSLAFSSLLLASCSVIKSNKVYDKVSGGYESISYTRDKDPEGEIRIYGRVTEAKSRRKVKDAEVIFLNYDGKIIKTIYTDQDGSFETRLNRDPKSGSIEIDGNNSGSITISNVNFGSFNTNTRIKARLFKYDYSITESDFPRRKDKEQLKKEIKEMKIKKHDK